MFDFEEIMFETEKGNDLITFDKSGNAVLPDFEDCTGALPWNRRLFYVEEGLRRYADLAVFQDFYKLRILPIKSDPTSEDSDGDDIADEEETFIGTSCLSNDTDKDGLRGYENENAPMSARDRDAIRLSAGNPDTTRGAYGKRAILRYI